MGRTPNPGHDLPDSYYNPERRGAVDAERTCEPSERQVAVAEAIVCGVPASEAVREVGGYGSSVAQTLSTTTMRTALREALSRALVAAGKNGDVDVALADGLVAGLDATRPIVMDKGTRVEDYPDYSTRGAFLDRLMRLTGDGRASGDGGGDSWDEMILRMRRPAVAVGAGE